MTSDEKMHAVSIDGSSLTLSRLYEIASGAPLSMPESVELHVERSRRLVEEFAAGDRPIYGVNTGFGYFANKPISKEELETLQLNLVKSHAAGYGAPLPQEETRLAMALRLNVLVKGYTGVRYKLCQALFDLIRVEIYPVIPEYGSVGASGDLAPLAHLALPLVGHGHVVYRGKTMPAKDALKAAKLEPIKLEAKEGLSLVNGTQIMLAVGGLALAHAVSLACLAGKVAALTYEALEGNTDALNAHIHQLRPHPGQIRCAEAMLEELGGSYLFDPELKRRRIQDPYSLRCVPQVHGASEDALDYAARVVEIELNSVTDNPLVFCEQGKIVSAGNFHGQPLAFAFDFAAMAVSELCNISERRLEQLLNPVLSGLPAFLTPHEGLNSGYMAAQYLSASVLNENKLLANPACTDSIPGNVGVEDHVSMGMTSARKLKKIVQNAKVVLAVELAAAAQAVDLRKGVRLGKGTSKTYAALRKKVPFLDNDRMISEDIAQAVEVLNAL